MYVQPYLFFEGRLEEALEFYKNALGAKTGQVMRFNDSPEKPPEGMLPPGFENKIMHAEFSIGDTRILASDGCSAGDMTFKGFSLAIQVKSEDEAKRFFAALEKGGKVDIPLAKTFWSPLYGCVTDRFGMSWMVNVEA
jgi:PhnB protein